MNRVLLIGGFFALLLLGGGMAWAIPEKGLKFQKYFKDAGKINGLPKNLLARVAYQESRFRDDIISGRKKSGAGAVGLMQIVPKWHPDVDPLNPVESIYYAANYLRQMNRKFGSWKLALAAYNWGPGNVKKVGGDISKMPKETRDYVAQITGDVWSV
jgi:soluble lytic murein transglycosylase-like protein